MKILAYVKPYKTKLIIALIASILATLVWLAVPLGLRELLDAVFDDGDMALLNRVTLVLIGLFISQALLGFWGSYSLDWIGEKIVADLRKNLYETPEPAKS